MTQREVRCRIGRQDGHQPGMHLVVLGEQNRDCGPWRRELAGTRLRRRFRVAPKKLTAAPSSPSARNRHALVGATSCQCGHLDDPFRPSKTMNGQPEDTPFRGAEGRILPSPCSRPTFFRPRPIRLRPARRHSTAPGQTCAGPTWAVGLRPG